MSDLERLIDERARAIVAEEKAAAVRAEEESRLEARRTELEAATARIARELALNRKYRGKGWPAPRSLVGWSLVLALVALFGMVPHFIVFPILHWTPASLACPLVCEGCSPSMTTLTRCSSHGSSTSCGESTYLCRNSRVDVDAVGLSDVEGARKSELAPYKMNAFLVAVIETVLSLLVVWPLSRRWDRRNDLKQEAELVEQLARAETELSALGGGRDAEGAAPYRGG